MLHPNAKVHHDRNLLTQSDWESFQSHRDCVMEIILGLSKSLPQPASLMLLGIGNGNDVDLQQLVSCYEKVTLVDLDLGATERAIGKVPLPDRERLEVIAPHDITGVIDQLPTDRGAVISNGQWQEIIDAAKSPKQSLAQADHVVSTCLLSQVIDSASLSMSPEHPRYFELLLAIRDGHLRSLVDLTQPSGMLTLITDFVSSETLPRITNVAPGQLERLLIQAVNDRNFFTGINPAVLQNKISPAQNGLIESAMSHGVWRWQIGPKCFAVTAMTARRIS